MLLYRSQASTPLSTRCVLAPEGPSGGFLNLPVNLRLTAAVEIRKDVTLVTPPTLPNAV